MLVCLIRFFQICFNLSAQCPPTCSAIARPSGQLKHGKLRILSCRLASSGKWFTSPFRLIHNNTLLKNVQPKGDKVTFLKKKKSAVMLLKILLVCYCCFGDDCSCRLWFMVILLHAPSLWLCLLNPLLLLLLWWTGSQIGWGKKERKKKHVDLVYRFRAQRHQ